MRIKVNDTVVVLTGKDRGKQGKVTAVNLDENKITVDGVNEVKRHVRRSQRNMQGGRLSKMMPVPTGKVMLVCPACNKISKLIHPDVHFVYPVTGGSLIPSSAKPTSLSYVKQWRELVLSNPFFTERDLN